MSSIKNIFIPALVTKIEEITFIIMIIKYIVGKTDLKYEEYNLLIFAKRNIKIVVIPQNIINITQFAFTGSSTEKVFANSKINQIDEECFSYCKQLHDIEISTKSILQAIQNNAFASSSIKRILIPYHIK